MNTRLSEWYEWNKNSPYHIFEGISDDIVLLRSGYTFKELKSDIEQNSPRAKEFMADLLRVCRDYVARKSIKYEHTK